jgi:hypothetical protein
MHDQRPTISEFSPRTDSELRMFKFHKKGLGKVIFLNEDDLRVLAQQIEDLEV